MENKHIYMVLAGLTLISFVFFSEEKMIAPKWGVLSGFTLLTAIAMGESWEAWKRKGQIILTTLGVGKGGATGLNPVGDIRLAKTQNKDSLDLAVIATGDFVFAGFSMNGNESFIVCPPEHVMQFGGNVIVKTKLRRVRFSSLPNHVQNELLQLPRFESRLTPGIADKRKNIYFGLTSSYYGTDTSESLKSETDALSKLDVSNAYSDMLNDILDTKDRVSRFKKRIRGDVEYINVKNNEE
jgi:hypothetical protein